MFFYNYSLLRLRRTTVKIICNFDFLGSSTAMVVYGSGLLWPLLFLRVHILYGYGPIQQRCITTSKGLQTHTATVLLNFIKDKSQQFCVISFFMYNFSYKRLLKDMLSTTRLQISNSYECWPLTFPAFQENIILLYSVAKIFHIFVFKKRDKVFLCFYCTVDWMNMSGLHVNVKCVIKRIHSKIG